ncbi:LsmAD domain-containing protein [Caenorhabditis elegans]|uniref:LsmAD domain-containing protein n=1 Tax=Caenorhabditis elegans TaxID=6239 RepID=A8WFF4_CAEEL|nr:LsmAD domain-containing protein [Caenorhabditis elegans]CCD61837.1 LsmAD domain-containing protein [Caenorhabditis elegans]|eukprot:NP_001122704.1 Uncharacterized protein CELE_F56C9.6 [Caenorhabditis elegans]
MERVNERREQNNPNGCCLRDEDFSQFNSEAFLRELAADLNEDDTNDLSSSLFATSRIPEEHIRSTFMLKGLVERAEHYNKSVDQRTMTDARIAFEEEQLKNGKSPNAGTSGMENLADSGTHVPRRGRGDYFGKLRSFENGVSFPSRPPLTSEHSSSGDSYFNNSHKTTPNYRRFANSNDSSRDNSQMEYKAENDASHTSQSSNRFGFNSQINRTDIHPPAARHTFNPAAAYNGKITPDFRFNYIPNAAVPAPSVVPVIATHPGVAPPSIVPSPIRIGQRYPKRPDNMPKPSSEPKHLNHNYYQIELYGATQEDRIAQRIEKTVRQTEAPVRRF